MNDIKESDWKLLRKKKDKILNDHCNKILMQIESLTRKRSGREHDIYLRLWEILKEKDKEISYMFDDLKRSNAIMKIFHMVKFEALPLDELEEFSEETKEKIQSLIAITDKR
jgi:hypothetical protein